MTVHAGRGSTQQADPGAIGSTRAQTAFIKQEALEKAREIKVKADEEFAIEKVRRAALTRARANGPHCRRARLRWRLERRSK